MIDDHKSQALLCIFNEVLTSWLHSAPENFELNIGQIFVHMYQSAVKNQNMCTVTMEWISGKESFSLPKERSIVKSIYHAEPDVFNAIQHFNSFCDCSCILENGNCLELKVALQVHGISVTLFENGNNSAFLQIIKY
jgi:hypothetical protein